MDPVDRDGFSLKRTKPNVLAPLPVRPKMASRIAF